MKKIKVPTIGTIISKKVEHFMAKTENNRFYHCQWYHSNQLSIEIFRNIISIMERELNKFNIKEKKL